MTPDDIVLTCYLINELRSKFNNALCEYEKLHKLMNEKLFEFNEKFDQVYFLLNKNERISIISNLKKIMFDIRQFNIPKFGMVIYKL